MFHTAGLDPRAGLAGSLGRSGRGAAKSSDPVGVAGRQNLLGVAVLEYGTFIGICWDSNPCHYSAGTGLIPLNNICCVNLRLVLLYKLILLGN